MNKVLPESYRKPFKQSFGNHTRDFKHLKYKDSIEPSKYMQGLKYANISPVTEQSIITNVLSKTQLNVCELCLSEIFYIIKSLNDCNLLNKRSEWVNTCRHQSNMLLKNFKNNRCSERSNTME